MTICKAVFIEYRNMTDGRMDRQTELLYQYRTSVCWRTTKNERNWLVKLWDGYQHINTIAMAYWYTWRCCRVAFFALDILINGYLSLLYETHCQLWVVMTCMRWLALPLHCVQIWHRDNDGVKGDYFAVKTEGGDSRCRSRVVSHDWYHRGWHRGASGHEPDWSLSKLYQ